MEIKIKSKTESFVFTTNKDVILIGRSSTSDFVVPHEDFSRRHCQLTFKGPYIFIMDLGSKNGVSLDGKKLKPNEQHPVYPTTHVFLANQFELILPNSSASKDKLGIGV